MSTGERNVSMVFQSYALLPHMSVVENVAYGPVSSGIRKREAQQTAEAAPETVGLKGFGGRLLGDHAEVTLDALRMTLPQRGLVDLVMRPEAIRLSSGSECIRATVARETYMGSHTEYQLPMPVGDLFCVSATAPGAGGHLGHPRPGGCGRRAALISRRTDPEGGADGRWKDNSKPCRTGRRRDDRGWDENATPLPNQ